MDFAACSDTLKVFNTVFLLSRVTSMNGSCSRMSDNEFAAQVDHEEDAGVISAPVAGVALILGIGTATPAREVSMDTYARNFGENLRLSEAQIQFAERICKSAGITRKYLAIPFERYAAASNGAPSLDVRLGWYEEEAVGMAERAAVGALSEWGGSTSHVTHIIVYSTSGAMSPGLDLRLVKRLGLPRSTKHFWVAFNGCHAGVMGIRTAAEIAAGSPAARVLVVWVEVNSCQAQAPDPSDPANNVVVASIFGDGAAAVVVGAPPLLRVSEAAVFEVHRCCSSYIDGADSEEGIVARVRQAGLHAGLAKQVPQLVGKHVGEFAGAMLESGRLNSESVNWAVHPGGRAIVDAVERGCHLQPHQLDLSRRILDQYSNMGAPTIIFVLKLFSQEPYSSKLPWTLALAFGPGISIEGALLRLAQQT